eukprot:15365705-Ditylum_brightwellii.AAC.1
MYTKSSFLAIHAALSSFCKNKELQVAPSLERKLPEDDETVKTCVIAMTDISDISLGKKEDKGKETSPGPRNKEGEKALSKYINITNTSNKKMKEKCREMNKNKATANLPPYDDDSGTDKSRDKEKDDRSASTGGTAIDSKYNQYKEENCEEKVMYNLMGDDEDAETAISELTNLTMATIWGDEETMMPTKLTFSNEGEDDNTSVLTTMSVATNMLPGETEDSEEEDINPGV